MKPTTSHDSKAVPGPGDLSSAPSKEHAHWELDRFLPYRLSVLSNRVSQTIAGAYSRRFGLGITEWRVIAVLGRYPGLSANGVAARTAMDKVAVSRAVARLLERGLLARDTHDDDRLRSATASTTRSCRWRWNTKAACSPTSTPTSAPSSNG